MRERFEAGLSSVTDLLRARAATLEADSMAARSRLDVVVGAAVLRHALGRQL